MSHHLLLQNLRWLPVAQVVVLAASLTLILLPSTRISWVQACHLLLYLLTSGTVIARDYKVGWLTRTPAQILSRLRAGAVPPGQPALESLSMILGAVAVTIFAAT